MKLYEDKDLFEQTILQASNELNIPPAIVEKDYYVTQMLKQLIAEDSTYLPSFPMEIKSAYSFIYQFLNYKNAFTFIGKYDLTPFQAV